MEPRPDRGSARRAGPSRAALSVRPRRGHQRQRVDLRLHRRRAPGPGPPGGRVHVAAPRLGPGARGGGRGSHRRGGVRRVGDVPPAAHRAARCELLRGDDRDRVRGPGGPGRGHRGDRGGARRPARLDQRDHAARLRRHQDRPRAHRLPRCGPGVDRPREGGRREAGGAVRHRRARPGGAPGDRGGGGAPRREPGRVGGHRAAADAAAGPLGAPPARERLGGARDVALPAGAVRPGGGGRGRGMARELRPGLRAGRARSSACSETRTTSG